MQVSEQKDHVTHAVIGGGATIDFGISNSAEFFNILSSTLYKDQILAVTREVLCNAWDAHIEAGCIDTPVQITLEADKLIIRDFGKGIHKDDMGLIYGTYGNSTKKNDGNQTGGFGLGCKAPFAYTDHFEVQSNHDGIRTIYNLSKSSAQAKGKPGIVPIASFPTKETGLQVSIPILNIRDFNRYRTLIHRIIFNGDMNMTVNGNKIPTIEFDTSKANCLITRQDDLLDTMTRIMVRYGNVIYPVDKVNELANEYTEIVDHLNSLGRRNYSRDESYRIVFQAPPHSIAVTPSRESLSMQDHTVKTLRTLFEDFITMLNTDFKGVCADIATDVVDEAVSEKRMASLLDTHDRLPYKGLQQDVLVTRISDLGTMARQYMKHNYPASIEFRKKDIAYRLEKMVAAGLLDKQLVQSYLSELELVKSFNNSYNREKTRWLQRRVMGRLMTKLYKAGMDTDRLYVYDPNDQNAPRGAYNRELNPLVPARQASPKHHIEALPYLRNIVVLAVSRRDIMDRCKKHEVFMEKGNQPGFVFYHVGMKKNDKEEALAFFKTTGMTVVDLTFRQDWELPDVPLTPVVRKPPKKGVPSLKAIKPRHSIDTRLLVGDDAERNEAPEFMCLVSLRNDVYKDRLDGWGELSTRYIVDLFGDKGGITNNSTTFQKWIEKGAKQIMPYLEEKLCAYVSTSLTIKEHWAFKFSRAIDAAGFDYYDPKALAEVVYRIPLLRNAYGLVNNLSDEDKKYLHLWDEYVERFDRRGTHPDAVKKVMAYLDAIPLDPANGKLLAKLKGNKLLKVIDEDGMASFLKDRDPNSPDAKRVIDILTIILDK